MSSRLAGSRRKTAGSIRSQEGFWASRAGQGKKFETEIETRRGVQCWGGRGIRSHLTKGEIKYGKVEMENCIQPPFALLEPIRGRQPAGVYSVSV